MAVLPLTPPHRAPMLALIATITDFPSPSSALPQDYTRLIQQLDQLCPLRHFAMLGRTETGLDWVCSYQISDGLKQQWERAPSSLTTQLSLLDRGLGWCVLPIEHDRIQWLLACCEPELLPILQLLLECLAKRLHETQTDARLAAPASPLIRNTPAGQHKIERISRLIRLASTLPSQDLFSRLAHLLQQLMAVQQLLLVHMDNHQLEKIYPVRPEYSDQLLASLCHGANSIELYQESLYWYSLPLWHQHDYVAHLIIGTPQPLGSDDRLLLDFVRSQLTLLLALRQIRQQLDNIHSDTYINQRLQQLRQTNLRLQKQLVAHQAQERRLQFDALHDLLTGLPNRALLMDHLHHAMTHYHRYHSPGFSLIFIDVDQVKQINDSLGQNMGDMLLKEISRRLQSGIRQNDMLARLGGDQFVICLDSSKQDEEITPVLNRISNRLSSPFLLQGNELSISVSMGIASVTEQTTDISQLLHQADLAMYQAKRNGRNRIVSYSEACSAQAWASPEEMLAKALREGRIVPYFQPVIRLRDSRLTGFEVMARWITAEGELKDALDFIPLANQCGLIQALDHQLLRHTCQQLKSWLALSGQAKFKLTINLSGQHLATHQQLMRLIEIVEREGIAAGYLIFAFHERELSQQDRDTLAALHELRARGIQICLDNFGTGFSSLNTLFHFPVDYLKVDSSLTHRMLQSPRDLAMIRAMGDICQDLDCALVVEGIEDQQQLQKLIDMGCLMGQGCHIAPPMPGADIPPLLSQDNQQPP